MLGTMGGGWPMARAPPYHCSAKNNNIFHCKPPLKSWDHCLGDWDNLYKIASSYWDLTILLPWEHAQIYNVGRREDNNLRTWRQWKDIHKFYKRLIQQLCTRAMIIYVCLRNVIPGVTSPADGVLLLTWHCNYILYLFFQKTSWLKAPLSFQEIHSHWYWGLHNQKMRRKSRTSQIYPRLAGVTMST